MSQEEQSNQSLYLTQNNSDGTTTVSYTPDEFENPPIIRIQSDQDTYTAVRLSAQVKEDIDIPYFPPDTNQLQTLLRSIDAQRKSPITIHTFDPPQDLLTLSEMTMHINIKPRQVALKEFIYHFATQCHTAHSDGSHTKCQPKYLHPQTHGEYSQLYAEDFDTLFSTESDNYIIFEKYSKPIDDYIYLTRELKKNPDQISIFISHAIFDPEPLLDHFSKVAITNSYRTQAHEDIYMYNIYPKGSYANPT